MASGGPPGEAASGSAPPEGLPGRHRRSEHGQLPKVLGGGGEQKLIAGAVGTSQSQAAEFEDPLEVGEQHLDLLATVSGALVGWLIE